MIYISQGLVFSEPLLGVEKKSTGTF